MRTIKRECLCLTQFVEKLLRISANLGRYRACQHVQHALIEHFRSQHVRNAIFAILQKARDHFDGLGGYFYFFDSYMLLLYAYARL